MFSVVSLTSILHVRLTIVLRPKNACCKLPSGVNAFHSTRNPQVGTDGWVRCSKNRFALAMSSFAGSTATRPVEATIRLSAKSMDQYYRDSTIGVLEAGRFSSERNQIPREKAVGSLEKAATIATATPDTHFIIGSLWTQYY